jgi:hypothetical protein
LDCPPTLLRSSNVGALTFSDRVVMSYLKIRYVSQSNQKDGRACSPRSHVQGFVINTNAHITVLYELVNGEQCIVWLSIKGGPDIVTQVLFRRRLTHLNDSLGNFWGRENRKRGQHPVGVLLHGRG